MVKPAKSAEKPKIVNNENEKKNASIFIKLAFFVVVGAIFFSLYQRSLNSKPRELNKFMPERPQYDWLYEDDFFEPKAVKRLIDIMLSNKILTISDDTGVEGAGEEVPFGHPDCQHPLMTLSANKTVCHFPHRMDIATHYMKTGGFDGHMEYSDKMAARLFSFRHKLLAQTDDKELRKIYGEKFLEKAKTLCSKNQLHDYSLDKLVTEIFQFDVIVILPGQELPMHIDIPYFWGADRKSLPHWLLAVMKRSQLFEHLFIPQVQGVAWVSKHQYEKNEEQAEYNGGNFYFHPYKDKEEDFILVKSKYNSAILVDGTQVIHGVQAFKAQEKPPNLNKLTRYYILYDKKTDSWNLYDDKDILLGNYNHGDIRVSIVWRVHCFQDETERQKYHNQSISDRIQMKNIIRIFKDDLKNRGKLTDDNIKPIDLWTMLIEEYLTYPVNDRNSYFGKFSFNHCLLPHVVPDYVNKYFLKPILNLIC